MRDGERTIRFGEGSAAQAPELLSEHGFDDYTLLTTARAAGSAPLRAAKTIDVPSGLVDELSAQLLPDAGDSPLVALGGGRVIDTAKAIGGVTGAPVAAIPTTLSGAELTPFHRLPKGVDGSLGLDSLDFIELSVALEERFGIVIDEGRDLTDEFLSLDSLSRFILAKTGQG